MSEEINMKFGNRELIILVLIASAAFFYFTYNTIGLRLFLGSLLLFFIPFYLILDAFDLPVEEKLIFPFFIGLGIVPLTVFYFSKILVSFRLSILVCFVILIVGSILFRIFYKKRNA